MEKQRLFNDTKTITCQPQTLPKINKNIYMEQVYNCFVREVHNSDTQPQKIKVFKFKDTDLQVIIKSDNYLANLENILNYYIKQEDYEKCSIINKIKTTVMNTM